MNEILNINPLMQPVNYKGQVYFTGQYFHQIYQNNTRNNGKYQKPSNFLRLIRSIETYPDYLSLGDIIELTKEQNGLDFEPAFKETSGQPIMLINATAQVALSHHLDDEISKSISIRVNKEPTDDSFVLKLALEILNPSEATKMSMLKKYGEDRGYDMAFLPDYTDSKGTHHSLSELLKKSDAELSTRKANQILIELGFVEIRTRESTTSSSKLKEFKFITEQGEKYGCNLVNASNPKETQPHWYDDSFHELLELMNSSNKEV